MVIANNERNDKNYKYIGTTTELQESVINQTLYHL